MKRRVAVLVVPLAALSFAACTQKGESAASTGATAAKAEGTPLAHVGDSVITVEQFKDNLMKQAPFIRARYNTVERKKEFLDNMIRFELLAREAKRRGLDQDPDVQEAVKKIMVQKLVQQQFEGASTPKPTDEQLQAFYKEHVDDYVKPERVRVSQIFVAVPSGDAAARAKAKKKAEQLLGQVKAQAKDPAGFAKLAREASEDAASRPVGGDLQYRSKDELAQAWGAKLADAAFALDKVGDVSGVVEGDKGFHVLKLTGRQKALDRTFDQVKRNIEQRVKQEERRKSYETFLTNLREKEGVTVDEAMLEKVDVNAGSAGGGMGAMGMPMGHPAIPPQGGRPAVKVVSPHGATPTAAPQAPAKKE